MFEKMEKNNPACNLYEIANKGIIDWCMACVFNAIPKKDTSRLMFAYIFINMIRNIGKGYFFVKEGENLALLFESELLKHWDCLAVEKVKYNPSYYKFLPAILKEYLIEQCHDYEKRSFKVYIERDTIKVSIV